MARRVSDAERWAEATVYDLQTERQAELGYQRALVKAGADELALMASQGRVQQLEALILEKGHRPDD